MSILNEATRNQILSQSRSSDKYKTDKTSDRYKRRTLSKISSSTADYNKIDMNKFFKSDILDVNIKVEGETNEYEVGVSFSGVLEYIRSETLRGAEFDYRLVQKALIYAFNHGDIFVRCTCPDWKYRINYWSSVKDIALDPKETRVSDKTNPGDTLGHACKHVCLILSNASWSTKIARVIINYVKLVKRIRPTQYESIIRPAIYGDEAALNADKIELDSGQINKDIIDQANAEAKVSGRFKKASEYVTDDSEEDSDDAE